MPCCFQGPASPIAINCKQLAQNCYFPLCSLWSLVSRDSANFVNVIAIARLSLSVYLLTTTHSGLSVNCTVIASVGFLFWFLPSPLCFSGSNKFFKKMMYEPKRPLTSLLGCYPFVHLEILLVWSEEIWKKVLKAIESSMFPGSEWDVNMTFFIGDLKKWHVLLLNHLCLEEGRARRLLKLWCLWEALSNSGIEPMKQLHWEFIK